MYIFVRMYIYQLEKSAPELTFENFYHEVDILRVLQCVAVCCSVLQCVAVCCSVLQCVTFENVY